MSENADDNSWEKIDHIIQAERCGPPMRCSFFWVSRVHVISLTVALAALSWTFICDAQTHTTSTHIIGASSGVGQTSTVTNHCEQFVASDPQMSPLHGACEFALTYRGELPDFICEQTTTSTGSTWITVSKAEVRFERGREHYYKVTIDGKPTEWSSLPTSPMGFISEGEFGSDLTDLFKPPIVAEFKFRKDGKLGSIPSSIYEFHLAAEKNTFWAIRDTRGVTLHPEYEGELWLERQDGLPLRLELRPLHLPADFGFASVEITIDYSEIRIGGLAAFRLSSSSEATVCESGPGPPVFDRSTNQLRQTCFKNLLVFHDCRKFASKTRVITDEPQH
jgi:hypothetical protein